MPRMRSLKPSFFTNDVLAEVEPLGRLLFQGLWCMADAEGRLECRSKRIKVQVLPFDDCDIDALLGQLEARGFIRRYAVEGKPYIEVLNFKKHQRPHTRETALYPAPPELADTRQIPTEPEIIPAQPEKSNAQPEKNLTYMEYGVLRMEDGEGAAPRILSDIPDAPDETDTLYQEIASVLSIGMDAPHAERALWETLREFADEPELLEQAKLCAGKLGDSRNSAGQRQHSYRNWLEIQRRERHETRVRGPGVPIERPMDPATARRVHDDYQRLEQGAR